MTTTSIPLKIIQIEQNTIDAFCKSWPCSGLHNVHHIIVALQDGELVDIDAFCDEGENDPIDIEDIDGNALSALIYDADENAKAIILLPATTMHKSVSGWIY